RLVVLLLPTRQALVSATVKRSQLSAAIALMSTGQNSGRVLGPSLAGILIAVFGVAMSFAVQAGGFLLALVAAVARGPQRPAGTARERSVAQNLTEGVAYVWNDPTVFALMLLQAIPSFL